MKKPTSEELERAAVAAETGVWSKDHPCVDNYFDINKDPWPGQCLASLGHGKGKDSNFNGVIWLGENLPKPYGGFEDEVDGVSNFRYTKAIDDGKGKEVAAAIRSLI